MADIDLPYVRAVKTVASLMGISSIVRGLALLAARRLARQAAGTLRSLPTETREAT